VRTAGAAGKIKPTRPSNCFAFGYNSSGGSLSRRFAEDLTMTGTIRAVYVNGVLRPLQPLDIPENEPVIVTIACDGQASLAPLACASDPFVSYEGFDPLLDELSTALTLPHLPIDYSGPDPDHS
jgi:hypothetical protein